MLMSYLLHFFCRLLPPLRWFVLAVNYRWYRKRCGPLWVVDRTADEACPDFYDQIEKALQFIREHDPRRANRVEKHLRYIVSSASTDSFSGYYNEGMKACLINYTQKYEFLLGSGELTEQTQLVLTMELASLIVHEATHGRIFEAGIAYEGERRERIERLCMREETQFMRRAAPDLRDVDGKLVDWAVVNDFENFREDYQWFWQQSNAFYLWELAWQAIVERWSPEQEKEAKSWRKTHQCITKATEIYQPRTEGMLYARGGSHWQAKNYRQATADFQRILGEGQNFKYAQHYLATMLYDQQKWEEALRLWEQNYEPGEGYIAAWIASTMYHLGRFEEALEWLEREPTEGEAFGRVHWQCVILCALERYEDALQSFECGLADETNIQLGSGGFTLMVERALLLRKLEKQTRFQGENQKLEAIAKQHWASCETKPATIDAWVVKTLHESYVPGLISLGAYLLICPELAGQPRKDSYLKGIADQLLESIDSDANDYEALYQRSLLRHNEEYPWREVPESLTDGKQVFVVDMGLDRLFLPGEMLTGDYVSCKIATREGAYTAYLHAEGEASAEAEILEQA